MRTQVIAAALSLAFAATAAAQTTVYLSPGGDGILLPSNGSEGASQTASSLPPGFENGTLHHEVARSMTEALRTRTEQSLASRHAPNSRG